MKVAFFSNFLNHHQIGICKNFQERLGKDFVFISTIPTPDIRLKSGYPNFEEVSFNLLAFQSDANKKKALKIGSDFDVVIIGNAPEFYVKERLHSNKLTFRYSERIFKKGKWQLLNPRFLYFMFKLHYLNRNKNLHMLCAGAFVKEDFSFIRSYPNKFYKWGYFPNVPVFQNKEVSTDKLRLVYVARLLKWKHPELVIQLAEELMLRKIDFQMTIIGDGPLATMVKKRILRKNLSNHVNYFKSLPNDEVLKMMQNSNVFLMTSDKYEGWGAVLNEAMSTNNAVVVSDEVGACGYLIKEDVNGLVFKSKDSRDLIQKVLFLKNNPLKIKLYSTEARATIDRVWNAENAVNNFLNISESMLKGEVSQIKNGPCSLA